MFTLAYCLFEIPTGMMGDRLGPRRVLDIRRFAIKLYWKRATYFWTLIAASFAEIFSI